MLAGVRKHPRWRVDWAGEGSPEPGQLVRHVSPSGRTSYARVLNVRVVANRKPLPEGHSCRYTVGIERLDAKPFEPVDWTCWAYGKPKRSEDSLDPGIDTWSPLL